MPEKLITTKQLADVLTPYRKDIEKEIVKGLKTDVAEPTDNDLPTIYITGKIPTDKTYVKAALEYISKTDHFKSFIYIKLQGTSTLAHPKKNYTIAMYSDEARIRKMNKNFKGWGYHNNYVLKADYIDILKARNVVCAKLWGEVVRSRPDFDSLPEELKNSPNCGAIDGFPVRVYVNGEYHGLYNWTIPKCDWLFGLDEKNPNHALISAQINDNGDDSLRRNPCNFNTSWSYTYPNAWEIEVGCAEKDTVQDSYNNAIFRAMDWNLEGFDVQSYVDYYLFQDIIFGTDGLAKNMFMVTYDMKKWYFGAYDMDSTFDLSWEGEILNRYNSYMPDGYNNQYSLLFGSEPAYFVLFEEFQKRYIELRKSVLSYSSIVNAFENYISVYGEDIMFEDTAVWPDIPSATTNTVKALREFVRKRLEFLDEKYEVVI